LSKELIESGRFDDYINNQLNMQEAVDTLDIKTFADGLFSTMQTQLGDAFSGRTLTLNGMNIDIGDSSLQTMDMDTLKQRFGEYLTDEQMDFIAMLEAAGIQAHANVIEDGKGGFKLEFTIDSLGNGSKNGGGGGGGKSAAQKLIEKLEREKKALDHRLKMLQYTESFYEARGEYTNVN